MAKAKAKAKAEKVLPEQEAEEQKERVVCACGSGFVGEGATMCRICKALYDRDKRKAKAKAKAKDKKKRKKTPNPQLEEEIARIVDGVKEEISKAIGTEDVDYATKQIAWRITKDLETKEIEVKTTLVVSGVGNPGGGSYEVNVA